MDPETIKMKEDVFTTKKDPNLHGLSLLKNGVAGAMIIFIMAAETAPAIHGVFH